MKKILIIGCSILAFTACKNENKEAEETKVAENTEIKEENQESEWQELFNGEDLQGWKAFNKDSISNQWKAENGTISFTPSEGERSGSENLITEDEFESFELSLEWKISEAGNSGIMWAVQEEEKYDEPYLTGPEIQVLDNERHPDAKNGLNRTAGALYDMVAPSEDATKPAGEWNKEVIHIDYSKNKGWVELNGTKVVEFPVQGDEWKEMVSKSKFSEWEGFGATKKGHIALQDHGDPVWFRNIKIKEL
ncbi:3-keto-disaccharide hydrolase [Christiangramia sediminis]|uniref:DUF1080 domain-containing protein n=1 Tax=Christiangramia sediminis TaxID=2881336 RepID=A0A9X1RWY0_9FLAO|nr:DUF1080 domain-containing protein [Christiangramia sediminis]MCB7479990.1 DUF1080 domain-containing protein [Christiangramia sediminis]